MSKVKTIDINCDMGERIEGKRNHDKEIMPFISSCNIACGFHSGSAEMIENTITNALKYNIKIGAHPSYLDRENFGRQSMQVPLHQLQSQIKYQVAAVKGIVESHGGRLHHVKPHGALYNDMHKNEKLAIAVIEAVQKIQNGTIIYIMAGSPLVDTCTKKGIPYMEEVFSDRAYVDHTRLQSRQHKGAIIHNSQEIENRIDNFLNNTLIDIHGKAHKINPDTICVHSDTPGAVQIASTIYNQLKERNIELSTNR
jgi:UPF0271 protein